MNLVSLVGLELQGKNNCYRVLDEIARGGMGAIYEAANCTDENQVVAIKEACLDPDVCKDRRPEIRARLKMEMEILQSLTYPTLPKIYDQFSTEHNEYLVMEYIEGPTLMQIHHRHSLKGQILEEALVLGWTIQVLDTLHYMHTRPNPVIHRDIKPENLILTPDGRVVLVDFGLMSQVERSLGSDTAIYQNYGTVEYAPPEQYSDVDWGISTRSDLFSLGATMYYLLSGKLPPRPADRDIPFMLDFKAPVPSIRKINWTVSRHTDKCIAKALEIDPGRRYRSAAEMREALFPRRRFIPLPF